MATYTKEFLTGGSANGTGVLVGTAAIASGTIIHTVPSSVKDVITLWATNIHTAGLVLTIGFGATGATDIWTVTIPNGAGPQLVLADWPLASTLVIRATTTQASVLSIFGSANRIT